MPPKRTSESLIYQRRVSEYTPPVDLNEVIGDMNLIKLNAIFADVMKKKRR